MSLYHRKVNEEDMYYYPSDSENEDERAVASGRSKRAAKRRSGDVISSGDDLEDYDDELEALKGNTDSQRKARRRLANRECARRIRQKRLDLLNNLANKVDDLQNRNAQLLKTLTAIVAQWRDISEDNCDLKADLAFVLNKFSTTRADDVDDMFKLKIEHILS